MGPHALFARNQLMISHLFNPKNMETNRGPTNEPMYSLQILTVVLISINVLILSNQMDALYAEDGGNVEENLVVSFQVCFLPKERIDLLTSQTKCEVKHSLFSGFVGANVLC